MSAETIQLTDTNFEENLAGDTPLLVDFWAAWCTPCRMIAPSLEALATEYAGRARIGKLNVDEHGATAQKFGVTALPSLFLFKDGTVVDKLVGAFSKDTIGEMIAKHL